MTVKQLSVFLENKSGRLTEVLDTLGKERIRVYAATIADTSEYGILRLISSNPEKALRLLKEKEFSVNLTDVLALSTQPEAGKFAELLKLFSEAAISVEYMYAFSIGTQAILIMRTEDRERALDVIKKHKLTVITEEDLQLK